MGAKTESDEAIVVFLIESPPIDKIISFFDCKGKSIKGLLLMEGEVWEGNDSCDYYHNESERSSH